MHSVKSFMAFFEKKVNFFLSNSLFFRFFDDFSVIFEKNEFFSSLSGIGDDIFFFNPDVSPRQSQPDGFQPDDGDER